MNADFVFTAIPCSPDVDPDKLLKTFIKMGQRGDTLESITAPMAQFRAHSEINRSSAVLKCHVLYLSSENIISYGNRTEQTIRLFTGQYSELKNSNSASYNIIF